MNNLTNKPALGFKIKEFENRLARAHYQMNMCKLDALLITTSYNFRYFSGFDSHFWESPTRPWFLIIPKDNQPIAVVPSIGKSALKQTWIKNIHVWSSPNPDDEGVSLLSGLLNKLPNKFGNIGTEIGNESFLRMSVRDYLSLREKVKTFNFIDGSQLLWKLRMIKSLDEISKLKFICKIASEAYEKLPEKIGIGETERSICSKLKIDLIERGADHTLFMASGSGKVGYDQIVFNPTNKNLQKNDVLFIDTGSTYGGYFCDFNRNFGFGSICDETHTAYTATWNAITKGIEIAKPGKKCEDIFNAMNKILEETGSVGNDVGRMGHGFGLQLTEPPSNMLNSKTLLEPGMAITIEPVYEFESGNMIVQEEDIVITEDGNEVITRRSPMEIPLIK